MCVIFTPNLGNNLTCAYFSCWVFQTNHQLSPKWPKCLGVEGFQIAKPSPWAGIFEVWSLFAEVKSASTFEKACWIWAECLEAKSVRQITRPPSPHSYTLLSFWYRGILPWKSRVKSEISIQPRRWVTTVLVFPLGRICPKWFDFVLPARRRRSRQLPKNQEQEKKWLEKGCWWRGSAVQVNTTFFSWLWGFIVNRIPKTNQQLQKEVPSSLNTNNSTHEKLHTKMYTHSRMIHTRYLAFWYTHCMHIWHKILYVISHTSIYTD